MSVNHFPISVNDRIFRYRKFKLPISEIRISDIGKPNFLCRKIILIYWYRKMILFPYIGNSNFRYRQIILIFRYRQISRFTDIGIIFRYRLFKTIFWYRWINRFTDIGNSIFRYLYSKSADLPVSENQFTDIGTSFLFSDIGKSVDFKLPISVIQHYFMISVNQLINRYRKFELPI